LKQHVACRPPRKTTSPALFSGSPGRMKRHPWSEERAAIANSKAAATRGEFATDDQVRAVWAKHTL
jgi:hypothetical protein